MEEKFNKRKIKNALTLERRHIRKTMRLDSVEEIVKNKEDDKQKNLTEESKKDAFSDGEYELKNGNIYKSNVGPFQLVVIKLPWYKRAFKSLIGFLGFKFEF